MANTLSALNPEVWKPIVQDYLNNMLIARQVCNTKCEALLSSGDQVNFPFINDVRVQSYAQGTDLVADAIAATQSSLIVDQSKAAIFVMDPVQEKQALANYGMQLAYQSAYVLKNNIDQHMLATGVTGAAGTVVGGTLDASTMYSKMTDVRAVLSRQNATDGELFAVLDPERIALVEQSFVANGFNLADSTLKNGFAGNLNGFRVYTSNNLKYSVTLTMDTQPTNLDTITVYGVTWTWVTDGTAANPGEINIGADLADAKAILVSAINGTAPPAVGDYVDVSVANRRVYQNAQVTEAAFGGNLSVFTAFGKISASETFTAATNVFGTETSNLLFGRMGAISLAMQMMPDLYIREEPLQLAKNYITHTLWGDKVFTRDEKRLVKMSINA